MLLFPKENSTTNLCMNVNTCTYAEGATISYLCVCCVCLCAQKFQENNIKEEYIKFFLPHDTTRSL